MRIYSKILNASQDYNPQVVGTFSKWIYKKILPNVQNIDPNLLSSCKNLLENESHHQRVVKLIVEIFEKYPNHVCEILANWGEDFLKDRVRDFEEGKFFEEANLFLQQNSEKNVETKRISEFLLTIFTFQYFRYDILSNLTAKIKTLIKSSEDSNLLFEEEVQRLYLERLEDHEPDISENVFQVFESLLKEENSSNLIIEKFKPKLEKNLIKKMVILEQTEQFKNCVRILQEEPNNKENILETFKILLSLKPRPIFYKLAGKNKISFCFFKLLLLLFFFVSIFF